MTFQYQWAKRVAEYDAIRKAGNVQIRYKARRMMVICPKDAEFVKAAKKLLGKFRDKTGVWTFDRRLEEYVLSLCYKTWPDRVEVMGENSSILR